MNVVASQFFSLEPWGADTTFIPLQQVRAGGTRKARCNLFTFIDVFAAIRSTPTSTHPSWARSTLKFDIIDFCAVDLAVIARMTVIHTRVCTKQINTKIMRTESAWHMSDKSTGLECSSQLDTYQDRLEYYTPSLPSDLPSTRLLRVLLEQSLVSDAVFLHHTLGCTHSTQNIAAIGSGLDSVWGSTPWSGG